MFSRFELLIAQIGHNSNHTTKKMSFSSNHTILILLFLFTFSNFYPHISAEHVQEQEQEQQHRLSLINWTTGEIQSVEAPFFSESSPEIEDHLCKDLERKSNSLMVITVNLAIALLLLLLYTAYLIRELRKLKNVSESGNSKKLQQENAGEMEKTEKVSLKNMVLFKI